MIGQVGQRLVLPDLTLERLSSYEKEMFAGEMRVVKWRHQFRCDNGHIVVYTGNLLRRVNVGDRVILKATIKRHEPEWNTTRIMRPVLMPKNNIPLFT